MPIVAFGGVVLLGVVLGEVLVRLGMPAWLPLGMSLTLTVGAILYTAMHGYARLVLRWLQEPVGVGVILFALLALFAAPQMPDMFLGLSRAHTRLDGGLLGPLVALSPTGFPVAALCLGLFAWYWTRAALFGRVGLSDAEYIGIDPQSGEHPGPLTMAEVALLREVLKSRATIDAALPNKRDSIDWSMMLAPRAALSVLGLVILAPIVTVAAKLSPGAAIDLIWPTLVSALLLVSLYYALDTRSTWARRLTWLNVTKVPINSWVWRLRTLSLFAAAPFGWGVALGLFVVSLAAAFVTLRWPN